MVLELHNIWDIDAEYSFKDIHATNSTFKASNCSIYGSGNVIHGNENEITGDSNEIIGDGNDIIEGTGNRIKVIKTQLHKINRAKYRAVRRLNLCDLTVEDDTQKLKTITTIKNNNNNNNSSGITVDTGDTLIDTTLISQKRKRSDRIMRRATRDICIYCGKKEIMFNFQPCNHNSFCKQCLRLYYLANRTKFTCPTCASSVDCVQLIQ